jgi:biopolymer transport protein TolR
MAIISPKRGCGLYDPVADINVTPLVDVMLVLLIVFMITAPMLATGMRVDLPRANMARPLDPKEPLIVTVTKDARLYLGQDEVAREKFLQVIRTKVGNDLDRPIYVRGDRDVAYGDVIAVMDQLAQDGLVKFALVANPSSAVPVDFRARPTDAH